MTELSILMYHMIREADSPLEQRFACPPRRFTAHLRALRRSGYTPVPLARVADHIAGHSALPDKSVAVTLDDGYADNYSQAWPVLDNEGFSATVFVTVNTVGAKNHWMQSEGFPARPMLSWNQIREMQAGGISFGSHTLNHPRLSKIEADEARHEITDAKSALEDRLGAAVPSFAYPYGDLSNETVEMVREAGHTLACSTRPGFNRPGSDPLLLRRIEVDGTDPAWKVLQKMRYGTNQAGLLQPLRYYWGRFTEKSSAG